MSEPAAAGDVLELDDVHVYYGAIHALKGVSLRVKSGEIVTLIGARSTGSTSLARARSASRATTSRVPPRTRS
jgi:branched-chain amino acid transport system ATP-binding protein